jgi:hypothetical protein
MLDPGSMMTFAVTGGTFGVSRLANSLNALSATKQIGDWHLGLWIDWRHTAIRVNFDTAADAALAKQWCSDAGQRPRSALSDPETGSRVPVPLNDDISETAADGPRIRSRG